MVSLKNCDKWTARYPSLEAAIELTTGVVAKLRKHPSAELEARFGFVTPSGFQTGVSRTMIDHIIEMMLSSTYVTGTEWNEEQDFLFKDTVTGLPVRSRVHYCSEAMTVSTETIQKKKLTDDITFDVRCNNGSATESQGSQGVRISLKEEKVVEPSASCVQTDFVRIKQRRRFTTVDGIWAFDFSVSWSGTTKTEAERKQANNDPIFEIECELINPTEALAIYDDSRIATSLLLKMQQLLPHHMQKETFIPILKK